MVFCKIWSYNAFVVKTGLYVKNDINSETLKMCMKQLGIQPCHLVYRVIYGSLFHLPFFNYSIFSKNRNSIKESKGLNSDLDK